MKFTSTCEYRALFPRKFTDRCILFFITIKQTQKHKFVNIQPLLRDPLRRNKERNEVYVIVGEFRQLSTEISSLLYSRGNFCSTVARTYYRLG